MVSVGYMAHKEHVYGIIRNSAVEINYLQDECTIIKAKHIQSYCTKVGRKKLLHKKYTAKYLCTYALIQDSRR